MSENEPETHETYNKDTHVAVKKHHAAIILVGLAIAAFAGGAVYFGGGGVKTDENGKLTIMVPSLDKLRQNVVIKTPDGDVVDAKVQPAAQPAPNGQTKTVVDGFGAEHRIQRTETDVNRYDPIDRVGGQIGDLTKAVKLGFDTSAKQIGELSGQMKSVKDDIKVVGDRVTKLESAQATPAPAQPAPQLAPSAKTSQAEPPPVRVARGIVNPRNANSEQMAQMLQAYKALGPAPKSEKISGYEQLPEGATFTCPDGKPGRLVQAAHDAVHSKRWACDH